MQLHPLPNKTLTFRAGTNQQKSLDLSQPQVMGVLNMTPDSFSDGGKFNELDAALRHCEQMLNAGASIIDIGGESTRPNAKPVTEDEEIRRVVPIVEAIRRQFGDEVWLSIDTSTPKVMQQSVHAGADIWNDVRALRRASAAATAAELDIPVILMHMRGEPATMSTKAQYANVVDEVIAELELSINGALNAGVKHSNIIIDLGFGFAKQYEHHQTLLNQFYKFHALGFPLLFGISRKRFLGEVLRKTGIDSLVKHKITDRDAIGMAAALMAVQQGASIIRTHNVAMTVQGLALWKQIQSA